MLLAGLRKLRFAGLHMDDQFLVEVPEAPPQGPLLFFVRNRPRRIINAALIFIALAIPLLIFSWNIHKLATPRISWEFLLAAAIIALLIYRELILVVSRFHLLKPGPTLVLYGEGIYDRRLGDRIIPWSEITRMQRSRTDPWLYLFYVSKPSGRRKTLRLIHRLPSLIRQLLGRGSFTVDFAGLEGEMEAALRFVVYHLEEGSSEIEKPENSENQPQEKSNDVAMQ